MIWDARIVIIRVDVIVDKIVHAEIGQDKVRPLVTCVM